MRAALCVCYNYSAMTRLKRRYLAAKVARKRWVQFHERESLRFTTFSVQLPELGIYRKWNGSHARCNCGKDRKWMKQKTNVNIRNAPLEVIPNGGYYKRFEDAWNWD